MINSGRQPLVDAMRGLSLLGILLSNMLIFQYGMFGKDELELFGPSSWDEGLHTGMKILVEGSFMPIFTFLFGYGLVNMREGLEARTGKWKMPLVRRFVLLAGLGLAHSILIWDGDILLFYGIIGFLLMPFLRRKAKTLLIWAAVLFTLLGLSGFGGATAEDSPLFGEDQKERVEQYVKKSIDVLGSGTYAEIVHFRNNEDPMELDGLTAAVLALLIPLINGPMFLLGMYAGQKAWFRRPDRDNALYGRRAAVLIPLGLALKSMKYVWPDLKLTGTSDMLGMIVLALGYAFGFAWLFARLKRETAMKPFLAVGKLSLTNYLLQSVVCTTIFFGYGLGLFGRLGIAAGIGIALALYALQLLGSGFYLKRFAVGPVERLLRIGTYWSWSGKPRVRTAPPDSPSAGAVQPPSAQG